MAKLHVVDGTAEMTFERQSDGYYHVPIVDLGHRLQDNFGLTIREHEHFDPVDPVHSANSYHYYNEAIDVQDWRDDYINGVGWRERTGNLENLLQGSGVEVFGPNSGVAGHDTHLHLAARNGIFKLNDEQYNYLFGGQAGGRSATFAPLSSFTPPETPQAPTDSQVQAKARAQEYSKMSKADMNSAYDALRKSDPAKAAIEGKKMHRAFFNK